MQALRFVFVIWTLAAFSSLFAPCSAALAEHHYLFSYFVGNGEDGLHLAHSTDGYTWTALNNGQSLLTPTAGEDKLMRDPSIVQGPDGTFHMVWTVSWGEQGIGYSSSPDLTEWAEQRYIPVMEHESDARNCWAPELFYDEPSDQYLICWATTIPGRFSDTDGQTRRSRRDPGYNHRLYYVTTRDFETFSKTKLFYDRGFNVIDATLARDGERYVMFLKDETDRPHEPEKNIRVAISDKLEGPYSRPSDPITGEYWAEGPTYLHVDGKWLVYFDKYTNHQYGVVTSPDLAHWTDESEKLTVPSGMRHGTAFEVSSEVAERLLQLND
jgi:hypothetical protein